MWSTGYDVRVKVHEVMNIWCKNRISSVSSFVGMSVCCLRKVLAALKIAHTVCFESVLSSRSATNTHHAAICLLTEALQKMMMTFWHLKVVQWHSPEQVTHPHALTATDFLCWYKNTSRKLQFYNKSHLKSNRILLNWKVSCKHTLRKTKTKNRWQLSQSFG